MRATFIITTIVTVALAAFFYSGVFSGLVIFILMGRIPGTNYMFSADFMAGMMTMVAVLLAAKLVAWIVSRAFLLRPKHQPIKLPRRRYARSA